MTIGRQQRLESVELVLRQIAEFDPDQAIQNNTASVSVPEDQWGPNLRERLERTLNVYREFNACDLDPLTGDELRVVAEDAGVFRDLVRNLSRADSTRSALDEIREKIENHHDEVVIRKMRPMVAYLSARKIGPSLSADTQKVLDEGTRTGAAVEKIRDESLEILTDLKRKKALYDDMLERGGLSAHANYFESLAVGHRKSATAAFWATVGSLAAILVLLGLFYFFDSDWTVATGLLRISMLSALHIAVFWAIRSHRSHMHNAVVNTHRDNALKTLQALNEVLREDSAVRNVVLQQVAQTILSPQPSGYQGSTPATTGGPAQLLTAMPQTVGQIGKNPATS